MAIGRISGPLLKANLLRDGVDLAFENDLLYLDVVNARVGIRTAAPTVDLDVNGTTRTTNLIVDNQLEIGNFTVFGNTISSNLQTIIFEPAGAGQGEAAEPTIYHSKLEIDDIQISNNSIYTITTNTNIEFIANGTGKIDIKSSTDIDGDLYVTGNISADGNVVIGGNIVIGDNVAEDTITINAAIKSSLIPEEDITYDLGNSSLRWRNIYAKEILVDDLTLDALNIGQVQISGNTITTNSGVDLNLNVTNNNGIRLANFRITQSTVTNVTPNAVTEIVQSGIGYVKFVGTNGFVPPVGNDVQRPTSYAVVGMTRYNTVSRALEVWNGSSWASPAGALGAISEFQATDIAAIYALILG